jgi:TRAP-type C4-dicarboxylate transport system substrate-binding protein
MTDKYAKLRKDVPQAIEEAKAEGGINHRAQMIADLLADYDRMRDALAEIADYWNRDQNDQAMYDACWHAINTANAALAQEQGESDE